MLRSMTGYGAASGAVGEHALTVAVRSVNHRHLQVKSRLGHELAHLEGEVEKRVRAKLARGSISVTLSVERAPGAAPVRVDEALARRYVERLGTLGRDLGVGGDLDLATLVGLPGVLTPGEGDDDLDALAAAAFEALERALDALGAMRAVEGEALAGDLRANLAALRTLAGAIGERMPVVVREHHEALARRVAELLGDATVAPADLAREVAVLADRLDVSEELARLRSHLDQFDALLGAGDEGEAVGRKLDFLCQELFREINTIGSKCNDAAVAHRVVEAKTHAERLREQVQNVE